MEWAAGAATGLIIGVGDSPENIEFLVTIIVHTGWAICIWTTFESGCGIQMSQATPTKFSMLFKHNYGKLS